MAAVSGVHDWLIKPAKPAIGQKPVFTKPGTQMRIVGWPEEPDSHGGILPVTIVDVDFHGTPEELRAVGEFLLKAAAELDLVRTSNSAFQAGVELGNSNPDAGVGLSVNVVRHADE
jgi:hypothetical protein